MKAYKNILLLGLLLVSFSAWAARPFVTDDARLTNAGKCQVESWTRQYKSAMEFWVLPACNFTGNFEVTLGGGTFRNDEQQANTQDFVIQAKTLFKELAPGEFGYGVAIGKIAHPEINPGPNQFGNTYIYFPISYAYKNNAVLHTNLGLLKDKGLSGVKTTYGFGAEIPLIANVLGIVEIYGDEKQKPFYQIGVRYSVIPNLFQIDTTLGHQFDADSQGRWLSIGFRYTP